MGRCRERTEEEPDEEPLLEGLRFFCLPCFSLPFEGGSLAGFSVRWLGLGLGLMLGLGLGRGRGLGVGVKVRVRVNA